MSASTSPKTGESAPNAPSCVLSRLSADQLTVLVQGLVALEGSLQALNRPLPPCLNQLKSLLRARIRGLEERDDLTMTTAEAAAYLGLTERYILTLAAQDKIAVAEFGRRGRGYTNRYYVDSIDAYRARRDDSGVNESEKDPV